MKIQTAMILNTVLWITFVNLDAEIMIFQPAPWSVQPVLIMSVRIQNAVMIQTARILNSVMWIKFVRMAATR